MNKPIFEKKLIYEAILPNLQALTSEIISALERFDCSAKLLSKVNISVDEIFTNICSYAYPSGTGNVEISINVYEEPGRIVIQFSDEGIPYNPLEKSNPDVTLSADERPIGGLGIFLVKKMMDEIDYKYCEGKNVLTILKCIE